MVDSQSIVYRAVKPSCLTARRSLPATTFAFLLAIAFVQSALGQSLQTLHGHIPAAASRSQATGHLPATNQLTITIGLPLRNPEALTNLLTELYDPGSTNFRNFLTPEEFTDRFGPSEADYQAVKDFAVANGLTITHAHANRTLLTVRGAVTDIEKALHLNLLTYAHPTEARTFFAPDSEPLLPASLSLLHIGGLDNFIVPHPMSLKKPSFTASGFAKSYYGSGQDGCYQGYDFRNAYVPGSSLTGTGQSVALVEFDGYYPSDITTYENLAGLPGVTLTNVLLDGFNGTPVDSDGNMEVSLDIEMLVSMAPGLSRILVYEEPNGDSVPDDMLNQMATDNLAAQISASWTFGIDASTEQIFLQYQTQGISYFNAAGDSGAYTAGSGGVPSPADDPNITSVGGTTLTNSGPLGSWVSETVWSWFPNQDDAGSGGVSTAYSLPSWQQGISMSACQGSTTMRNIPDVALTADNIFVESGNGQANPGIGGTSAATPLWAGFMALVNQQYVQAGRSWVGFINPQIYTLGKSAQYASYFHDITTGNNTNSISPNLYYAVPGYDLCTGWGTPMGTNLINALAPYTNSPIISLVTATLVAESCLPTNGAVDPDETVTYNITLDNVGSLPTTNLVATLQSNSLVLAPSGAQTYGALAAAGSSVTKPFTFTAGGVCASPITLNFQLQDGAVNRGTISTTLYLGKPFSGTNFSQNFDSSYYLPTGWTSTASGAESVWSVSSANYTTAPYCVFAPDAGASGISDLVSPAIPIGATNAQLTFANGYDTYQSHCGCVLEIQIGTNAYADILAAGGSFAAGGYNSSISVTNTSSVLAGRQVWSGSAGNFQSAIVNLPAAAAGQTIHLRWRLASDNYYSYPGWYIDTVAITESYYACCSDTADLGVTETASTNTITAGQNLSYIITVTNSGPQAATGVSLTNTLPPGVTFVSASSGGTYASGKVIWTISSLSANTTNKFSLTVTPTVGGMITNTVAVGAITSDPNLSNQTASVVTTVDAAPSITTQPASQVTVLGSNTTFQVTATGMPLPAFHWYLNGTNLAGATAGTLTLTNIQMTQQGGYYAVLTNLAGSATSAVANLTVAVKPASFQVAATGTPMPVYQWCFNGTNIAAATNSSLSLSSAQPAQAGSYTVLLTNLAGSVTSTAVALNVTVPLPLLSFGFVGTNLAVSLSSLTGVNYTLQFINSLSATNWTAVGSPLPGTGSVISLQDTNTAQSDRFYRVLCTW